MPTSKHPQKSGEESPAYPTIEKFLESRDRDAAASAFADTKAKLEDLKKGAKAGSAKKVLVAVERAEALVSHLYDVRDQLAEKQKKPAKTRR